MAQWFLGSMGFSYKDWKGPFYPEKMDPGSFLSHYSRLFNAVEIDSTFYGIPKAEVIEKWRSDTPEGFKICPKLPKIITHEMELVGVEPVVEEFFTTVRKLGDRLGAVLVQFRPSFNFSHLPDFITFINLLPTDIRIAIEFRHRSWYQERTAELLSEYGLAWAATEYLQLPTRIHRTTDFLYIRFIGQHGRFPSHGQERIDTTAQLEQWRERIWPHLESVDSVFGFFNNDYSGFSIPTLNRFRIMVGLDPVDYEQPSQPRLF